MLISGKGSPDAFLRADEAELVVSELIRSLNLAQKRLLVIIPDGTRSGPIGLFFRLLCDLTEGTTAATDFLIALGTHQKMSEAAINRMLGLSDEERSGRYGRNQVFNHRWDLPETFITVGTLDEALTADLSGGKLHQSVDVRVNKMVTEYDHLLICGPVFPHEVAGFSGGNKYFFPGISGPEVIHFTHWLGALITSYEIIGTRHTPVRAVINRAAACIPTPRSALCMAVKGSDLYGVYGGSPEAAWEAAAGLSEQVHIRYVERPFKKVLSMVPKMYEDLWTGAKGMYKLEPVVADGGELILYAPHITEVSYTHGREIDAVGYHVRDFFTEQWDRYSHHPWGVLAHSTHVKGTGTFVNGVEKPRIRLTLATGILRDRCERINLGYCDPDTIDPEAYRNREDEGILLVPHAGEVLYRLKK